MRWNSCNVLQVAPGANRLWQFDAKGGAFVPGGREVAGAPGQPLPAKYVAKSWTSLWQPKLNIAWLPPENVFLRVVELPKSSPEETLSMIEFQLEKLSPIPVTQIVWTFQILPESVAATPGRAPQGDEVAASVPMQTIIVVIASRAEVEEFLGKLEAQGYLADRLEVQLLDLLQSANKDGAWIYPMTTNNQTAALVAWRTGGALRSLSFVVLPQNGDRAQSLKEQLAQLVWAGELEGWLTSQPQWYLVAEPAVAGEWENLFRQALNEPVQMAVPLPPKELAACTALRAAGTIPPVSLLPAEFSSRYHEQFFDRLWLHGLYAAGILYTICVIIYFCATYFVSTQTQKVEQQAAAVSGSYTNAMQLKARYDVLKEREDLKFAALDCWKLVADQMPAEISLQRLSFAGGRRLSLNGTVSPDEVTNLFYFYNNLHKSQLNGQPMFDSAGGQPPVYRQSGNQVTWNFALDLQRGEEAP